MAKVFRRTRWLLIIAAALTLGACATLPPPSIQLDPSLNGYVTIKSIHKSVSPSGLLQVEVTGKNTSDQPLYMYYQFDWLDKNGQAVPSLLAAKTRVTADRNRWFTIRGVAPSPAVTDFRLYLDERDKP
ncbi:DUF1425 domain-containing protein [Mangrovitalea sediminis]|uniref:DUF1425 domain-containing protein n=1 Tax=Mangrovitalea sediminis TaxID=1982043 RepID=UPI0013044811|nr:YcfL family protein [Mangrovitalea sediminis]